MKNKIAKVYLVTNKTNNKQYIGITVTSIKARWNRHVYDSKQINDGNFKQALHDAIRKYGKDQFTLQKLYESDNHEHIKRMETHFINLYQTHGSQGGYNMTWGGDGWHGMKHTEESKKKMSKSHTGKVLTKEHKENIKLAQLGRPAPKSNPEQWKKNLSESKRKNPKLYYEYEITCPNGNTVTTTNLINYCEESNDNLNPQPFGKAIKDNKPYKGYTGKITKVFDDCNSNGIRSNHTKETKKKIQESHFRYEYTIHHPDGRITKTKNLKDFCERHNIARGNMTEAAKKNEKEKTQKYGSKGYRITRISL